MTYLVLARKWRPRSFDTLVGQDHVVRALTHALKTQRLHHAWLFTGTRGVGKTTLSRILAKSLNCETGITPSPCGVCNACVQIDEGRFVDYLELDAASNRGVDEMTQLLEQAVYSPSVGRFKVYMIDEVHMLSGHAFNAMLKTLEEPPPHVKFILATTDPQKIPVTVLSRCLQFNLKQMPAEAIVGHLDNVLGQEGIPFERPALRLLAQAASGSMRDALSLTDQAISYSAGNLTEEAVRGMLGTIDQRHLARLLDALNAGSASAVMAIADELAERGLSYRAALADLAVMLSRVAMAQRVEGVIDDADPMADDLKRFAFVMHPDAVQLFYTIAVHSRSELAIAPDEYAGFVMACLRMLSLNGDSSSDMDSRSNPLAEKKTPEKPAAASRLVVSLSDQPGNPPEQQVTPADESPQPSDLSELAASSSLASPGANPEASRPEPPSTVDRDSPQPSDANPSPEASPHASTDALSFTHLTGRADSLRLPMPWSDLAATLPLSGMAAQLARQSELVHLQGRTLCLRVPNRALSEGPHTDRLKAVLVEQLGGPLLLEFQVGEGQGESAHAKDVARQLARQRAAEQSVEQDPFVKSLLRDFDGRVVPGSVQPGPSLQ